MLPKFENAEIPSKPVAHRAGFCDSGGMEIVRFPARWRGVDMFSHRSSPEHVALCPPFRIGNADV